MSSLSWFRWAQARMQRRLLRRAALALSLACALAMIGTLVLARERRQLTNARLHSAAEELDALTDAVPADDSHRAAIAWGYAERMRLGLESPFRLIEAAATDVRLPAPERRTVSWALLAHVIRGETHHVEPAALDLLGPSDHGAEVKGEQHVALMTAAIRSATNPRAAELAVRFAYSLAAAERIVDGSAPLLAAEAAALLADREIARREGIDLVRTARGADPIEIVRRRRERRAFYVERPALLSTDEQLERTAVALTPALLDSLRAMRPQPTDSAIAFAPDEEPEQFAAQLRSAAAQLPPAAPLAVTVQRYLPVLRVHAPDIDTALLARAGNSEMLVAALQQVGAARRARRAVGRLILASAVSMRSYAQEPVSFPRDTSLAPATVATKLGVSSIAFDRDVPPLWRPYLLQSLLDGVRDLRRVLPAFSLADVQIRFRMTAPADSALAMHDPRTRTLHLPALTAGGTLLHELAHELDRQSAVQAGLPGYRSDAEARADAMRRGVTPGIGRVAASLRALTEDVTSLPRAAKAAAERPAEIFATRVDWFVAEALARDGISNGFLTGVQDDLLTGPVVHPERLRSSGRSRSLLDALEGMTTVARAASQDREPSIQTVLRWSLAGPVDRRVAAAIVQGGDETWRAGRIIAGESCGDRDGRVALVRLAAESRARGWLRQRARWMHQADRPAWARAVLEQGPWNPDAAEGLVAELRDHVLVQLASSVELPAGLSAYAAPIAAQARCE